MKCRAFRYGPGIRRKIKQACPDGSVWSLTINGTSIHDRQSMRITSTAASEPGYNVVLGPRDSQYFEPGRNAYVAT